MIKRTLRRLCAHLTESLWVSGYGRLKYKQAEDMWSQNRFACLDLDFQRLGLGHNFDQTKIV